MTNLQAAIGVGQLEHINDALDHKLWMKAAYESRLKKLEGLQLPTEKPWARNVYWMYGVVLDKSLDIDAAKFAERLLVHGIMTRPFFVGMHEQPVFKKRGIFMDEKYPVSERIASYGLYLPSGLTLTQNQIDRVCDAVEHELVILKGN
jgi:perosamine synthetase